MPTISLKDDWGEFLSKLLGGGQRHRSYPCMLLPPEFLALDFIDSSLPQGNCSVSGETLRSSLTSQEFDLGRGLLYLC
jgi:hypothetical protein